jgi:hypothetical protein
MTRRQPASYAEPRRQRGSPGSFISPTGYDGTGPDEANLAVARVIARGERPEIVPTWDEQLVLGI